MYFDLTAHLENELQKGNLNATLSDLDWSSQIQAGLDSANRYLEAAFLLYIFSIVLLLSAMIPSAIMVFFTSTYAPLSSKICLLSAVSRSSSELASGTNNHGLDNVSPGTLLRYHRHNFRAKIYLGPKLSWKSNRCVCLPRPALLGIELGERRNYSLGVYRLGS